MNDINSAIRESVELLYYKGYDEKRLNNGEAEGMYREHVSVALKTALERDVVLFDDERFAVHMFGKFNEEKDTVHFIFRFDLDAYQMHITLREVEARLNNIPICVQLEYPDDLWSSQELYERLKDLQQQVAIGEKRTNHQLLVQTVIKEILLLKLRGYEPPENDSSKLQRKLHSVVEKAKDRPVQQLYFSIETPKVKANHEPTPHFKLHYCYYPQEAALQLRSIIGTLGTTREIVFLPEFTRIPTAAEIVAILKEKQQLAPGQLLIKAQSSKPATPRPTNWKKGLTVLMLMMATAYSVSAQAWDEWFNQKKTQRKYLLEQIVKLQLYLGTVKKGYRIAEEGLNWIGDIKHGDLQLHTIFFDDKKKVKASIRHSSMVASILEDETAIQHECNRQRSFWQGNAGFTASDQTELARQQGALVQQLSEQLQDLQDLLADDTFQMNDQERLERLTRMQQTVAALRQWNQRRTQAIQQLALQRKQSLQNIDQLKALY